MSRRSKRNRVMIRPETRSTSVSMFGDIKKLVKIAKRQAQNERLKVVHTTLKSQESHRIIFTKYNLGSS